MSLKKKNYELKKVYTNLLASDFYTYNKLLHLKKGNKKSAYKYAIFHIFTYYMYSITLRCTVYIEKSMCVI